MNKDKIISVSKDTIYYLTHFFPLAFCMAVCFGLGATMGIIFSCITIILAPDLKTEKIMPLYAAYIILGISSDFSLITCGIFTTLFLISDEYIDKIIKFANSPAVSGVMLSTALTATVLFTTDYFGIGATGETVTEMIKSYISLGFHPNWRGVLYGTIVMVIMITFPRKFKRFSKTVSAAFIGIVITLALNFFLNPSYMPTAITELDKGSILSAINISDDGDILNNVLCAISLFIIYLYSVSQTEQTKRSFYISGTFNLCTSETIGLPLPYGINRNKNSLLPRFFATGIIILFYVLFGNYVCRIPLHSCAVVIIVGAWQNVKWGELKKAFSGVIPIIMFIISVLSSLLFDLTIGVAISAVLSVIYHKFLKKAV